MKRTSKLFNLGSALLISSLAFQPQLSKAAAFTPGNVVVYRVGSGTGSLVNTGNPVFVDEYTATGTLVQSIALPTTVSGANKRLVSSGTATSEGMLTRSADGQYLILTGYDVTPPAASSLSGTTGAAVNRVIGRVNAAGTVDTSTALTDYASANNPRSAVSSDGSKFWLSGGNGGVRLATLGATTSTDVSTTVTNLRQLGIEGGQLFVTTSSGTAVRLGTVGTGLPETTGQTITNLTGIPTTGSPYAFFFADLDVGVAGLDTVYIADDTNTTGIGGVRKFSLVGSTWTANGIAGAFGDAYRGLTGSVNAGTVTLYATRKGGSAAAGGGELVSIVDATGYNATITATPTLLATAAANTAFRGVVFAPAAPVSTPTLTIAATDASAAELGTDTGTFRITRTGDTTNALSVSYTLTTGAGQAVAADYTPALTGTATIAATQSFVDVTITPVDDFVLEGGETVALTLTDTVDYDLGATTTASVTITDDETNIDLSRYVRVGRYDLPEPTRTTPPSGNLLGQEASGVAYNWDTDTLFIVGDGGTSVTEVTKAGALVSTMTLSGNGNDFLDTEGITYIGGGQFVLTEERVRQAVKFTYVAGGALTNATAERVKLGTTIGNIGLEGLSYDPQTSGFLFAKESDPQGLFQTTIDFTAGTASNGSATTLNSTNLFTPALASLDDMSDVFAFSNLAAMTGQAQSGNLLILSQESGLIRHMDRSGNILSTLTLVADAGNPLTIQNQTHEGVTMDREGRIYVVSENGGGDIDHPQLWVFAPAAVVNTAPTAIVLSTASTTIPENTSTAAAVKLANFTVTDVDGVGVNSFSVSGTDAADFQVIGTAIYLKAGTVLNGTTKPTYTVTVNVDDTSVGTTPDASANFTLNVTPVISGSSAIRITEVAPWSSGNSPDVTADWFELTNTGTTAIDITGWLMFDSGAPAGAGPLNGITTIAAGESVIFVDGQSKISGFLTNWFGASPPSGLQVGYYGGPGLSTGGDSVTIFNPSGTLQARVDFGASPSATPFGTFDNTAGLNNAIISQLSAVGQNGAFSVTSNTLPPVTTITEIGSPGYATISSTVFVSITATDANAAEASTDSGTFRISRTGSTTLSMDVLYGIATGSGQATSADYTPALGTTATIPAGASFVDVTITPVDDSSIEGSETLTLTLGDTGSYDVGSPASAMVTIIDNDVNLPPTAVAFANTVAILSESANTAADVRVADITVTDDGNGTNTLTVSGTDAASFSITGTSLYLKAGTALSFATKPSYSVTVNVDDTTVGITPDLTANFNLAIAQAVAPGALVITEVHSSGSSATYAADWFELQNVGATDLTITGWKMDDNSNGTPSTTQVALRGLTVIPAGKSAVFFEGLANGSTDATILANFCTAWFGSSTPPPGVLIGSYGGAGVGMSGTADALNIFDAAGNRIAGVAFGAATVGTTFDNKTAALGSTTLPLPIISTLSVIGTNGAFRSAANTETGSPGSTVTSSYYPQSVASGDPRSSSVVLWTRVLDGHTAANREVSLHLSTTGTIADVGTTAALGGTNLWTGGTLTAQSAHDGVVKVKVGSLAADTTYYYQFTYNGQRSPIGRTKTAPAAGSTRTVKYAAINCNDFVGRYFNVLRQLAEREQNTIDFVLNLGDYVYETTGDPSFQTTLPERAMVFSNPAEAINLGSGNYAAQSVGNYRDIYKTIRQDAQLRRVHELFPMISIWDDHEFSDDNWKDNATYFDGKVNEQQTNRKKNGEQAWMEFLPTERGMAATGNGLEIDSTDLYPNTVIYDAFNFGTNLDLILTDIRTNRADHLIPEDACPSGIPMTETDLIATLAAANGLDVPTFTAAVWPGIRGSFAPYVNIDDPAYAAVKAGFKTIIAASVNNAMAALPAGQTPIITGAVYADANVVGFRDAGFINQAFVAAGQSAPFDAAALAAMPRGLSYYLLGKTSVFSDFGSRYQVVNQTFQLFAGYTYQAFLVSGGALGRDQAFYNSAQQTFLATALGNSTAAGNKWRVVASSTPYTPIKFELGDLPAGVTLPTQGTISGVTIPASLPSQFLVEFLLNADEPAGFPQFRQGMIDLFAQHDAIIVSGDIHAELIGRNNATNGQKVVDFTVPSAASSEFRRAVSGAFTTVEGLMTPAVQAATGLPGSFAFDTTQKQAVINATDAIIKHNTSEMFQADTAAHGYTVFTAGSSAFNAEYQKINVSEIDNNHYALSSGALDALFHKENFTVTKTGSGPSTDLSLGVPQNNTTIIIGDATISEGNSGSTLNFTVTRSDLLGAFTVDFATSSGTAASGSDFTATSGTLTFTAGGSTTQNVSIAITGDTIVEPNETFLVTLSNVVNTAGTAAITDATATGTITNDDTTPVVFPASNSLSAAVKGSIALAGAEIPAFDPLSDRAFASSGTGIQVVNLANPAAPVFINTITPSTLGVPAIVSNDISSVSVRKGSGANPSVLAAAIINNPKTSAGHVVFLNAATGALIGHATVGIVPDHIAWTPDGSKLLVCNEGELSEPETTISLAVPDAAQGTVSIISVDAAGLPGTVQTADFAAFDAQTAALKTAGVRIFDDGVPSTDFEPEYLAVSPDGTKAMVTLQEANAVAVLDIASATFTSVAPLGKKDFSTLRADFSDADSMKNPRTGQPVFGLYMPDAIASFASAGQTYYVTANEGDDRNDFIAPNETTTVNNASYVLDPTVFPDAATLKLNANLGKLTVSNLPGLRGDTNNDGDIDEIFMYGARSFSILDSTGALVFDSGDMIEMIVASLHGSNFDDGRSDNKGPEPEGVAVATLGARTFAFVGLERSHMTLVFDVTNPLAPTYVTSLVRTGDTNPEGIVVVSETDSPSGRPLVLVTNEVSNTLSVFELTPATAFTMQLLHLADAEAGLLASQTAPNLAALVDAFDGTYANTLILAGGDNYIPGPFAAAGTDALVAATHTRGNNPFAADIEIHNRLGVEASTVGNHEFDFGTNAFSDAILDTNFPYLSSNLDFSGDAGISARYQETVGVGGLEEASSVKNKIVPSCVVTKGTQKIGLVGVTTQIIEAISSTGGVEVKGFVGDGSEMDNMVLLASQVQPVINELKSQGVNKIILMAHLQQIANELMLAPMLTDVDIILAAGSNTRLGDANDVAVAFTGHAANFAGNYPIYTAGADGKPTVVVNTDNEFTYLGRLVADFDADGNLIVPNLLANTAINGAYAATAANVAAAWNVPEVNLPTTAFAAGTKGALVKQITDAVQGVITVKDGDVRGFTNVYLEGERNFVRNQETNLGNVSADSMITVGKTALPAATHVAAMKNGGGIRAAIGAVEVGSGAKLPPLANPAAGKPAGAISLLDIENSMRFNNGLMLCDTTPAGLKAILEHGVALLGNQGRFPQIGGIRFSYNPSGTAGSRIQSIVTIDDSGAITGRVVSGGAVLPTAPATITLVTLNFLAQGGDGYPFKANADNFRFLLTTGGLSAAIDESLSFTAAGVVPVNILGEQAALSSHLQARHANAPSAYNLAETTPALDTRIQSSAVRTDTVLSGPATFAAWLAQNGFTGSAGGDTDNDGVPDSLEYFFNSSPNSGGDRDNLPTVTMNGADLEFRFTYLNNTVFTGFLQCSEDLINWASAIPGVDYEVITETVNGVETAVRFRIFCNPLPTTQGPFTYLTPFTAEVERGAIDQLTITNHGMVGAGRISGEALDSFGETQGAASGLSITGWSYNSGSGQFSGTFNVLPDRGYNNTVIVPNIYSNYAARIHQVPFTFTPYYGAGPVAQTQIMPTYSSSTKFTYLDGATTKFTTGLNAVAVNTVMGQSVGTAPAANGPGGATTNLLSFDAEAIHVFPDGSGFVSDEYGTYIARFNAAKQFTKLIQLPASAQPHKPVGTLNFDAAAAPTNGRRNNQGLEGLAVSPDNKRLMALMQSALVQDTSGSQQQTRFNTRLYVYDIEGVKLENPELIGEYVVQLPRYDLNGNSSGLDVTAAQSEIVAISNTQFLMLPRDGNGLGKSTADPIVTKTVDLVDFSSATNVRGLYDEEGNQISPAGNLRATITPAKSTVVINLLSTADLTKFGFNTNTNPITNAAPNQFTVAEKIEAMSLVPDTSTASTEDYFLFIANDNDFQSSDVKMLDATGSIVSYGDARSSVSGSPKVTNDAVFTAWRITICPKNRKFFRLDVNTAP
jgi:uncharacterized protein YjiK/phosphodiesterase/alkaline phosphatase D-like protein/2',3'-cyclic-nucleotide 2'-phosphodiesterase (5'-nucleotidase family)